MGDVTPDEEARGEREEQHDDSERNPLSLSIMFSVSSSNLTLPKQLIPGFGFGGSDGSFKVEEGGMDSVVAPFMEGQSHQDFVVPSLPSPISIWLPIRLWGLRLG